jgi:hypothetical protein
MTAFTNAPTSTILIHPMMAKREEIFCSINVSNKDIKSERVKSFKYLKKF